MARFHVITLIGICSFVSHARDPSYPQRREKIRMQFLGGHLSLLVAEDIGVTGIEDSHGRAAEELTAGGTELNLYEKNTSKHMNPPKSR